MECFLKSQLHQIEAPMNHSNAAVQEWEAGLPAPEELMPLTQTLIPHDLASAFKIIPDPPTSASEIQIASENTLAVLGFQRNSSSSLDDAAAHPPTSSVQENHSLPATASFPFIPDKAAENSFPPVSFLDHGLSSKGLKLEAGLWNPGADQQRKSPSIRYEDITTASNGTAFISLDRRVENGYGSGMGGGADSSEGGSGKKLRKRLDIELEDVDSSVGLENSNEEPTARTLKRPRLVWTPQLHKRFVDAVAHLGIKNAVPKTIMQLMNVEGLTRENVASHLQKYRLYLKRMQGLSTEGPSVSDHLFASTPVPPSLAASAHFLSNHGEDLIPLLVPMPMAGMGPTHMVGSLGLTAPYPNFDHNLYNGLVRPLSSQRFPSGDQEFVMDSQGRPGSPQRRVLTLFPTSGT